jgi:hypothetical protein
MEKKKFFSQITDLLSLKNEKIRMKEETMVPAVKT